jgi:hypothetical protein
MVTPEQWAGQPEQERDEDILPVVREAGALAVEQEVRLQPDAMTMSETEFRTYVHWTALSGDARGTGLEDLSVIHDNIYASHRSISGEIAKLTSEVTMLQAELPSAADKDAVMAGIVSKTEKLYVLYDAVPMAGARLLWVKGYIGDRLPN